VLRAVESFAAASVNLLGVVINRVGSDKNDTLYGYGTEYGYGYGYGYGSGYGQDPHEESSGAAPDAPAADSLAADDNRRAQAGVVTRRVA
jgi:Mrp family chromosome partitioning ATPase